MYSSNCIWQRKIHPYALHCCANLNSAIIRGSLPAKVTCEAADLGTALALHGSLRMAMAFSSRDPVEKNAPSFLASRESLKVVRRSARLLSGWMFDIPEDSGRLFGA